MMLLLGVISIFLVNASIFYAKKRKCLGILAITFLVIAFSGTEILVSLPMETTVVSRDYIPIHNVQDFTLTYYNGTYVFSDGYGKCFVISPEQLNIETFPDEELKGISVSKATIKEYASDNATFWFDFNLIKPKADFKEVFEFSIPESSLKTSDENSFDINELSPQASEQQYS